MSRHNGTIQQAFKKLFNIHKGESEAVRVLLCFSFISGVSFVFYATATVSVFISSFRSEMLPYAYIASGVVGYLLWYGFARVQKLLSFGNLLLFGYLFLLVSIAFLFIMAEQTGNRWWYFSMFVWLRFFTFLNAVMFGGLVARIFNLQQGKRLFGLISAGDVVSQMLGYFSIPFLTRSFGVPALLLIALSGIVLHLLVIVYVRRKYRHLVAHPPNKPAAAAPVESAQTQSGKDWRYYCRLLFVVSLLPMLGFYYVDYMFLNELRVEYTSKEAVAGFLGLFLGGVAVVELITRLFVSGRLLTNYGLKFGINILPLALTFSSLLIVFFFLMPGFSGLVFSMLALSKLLDRVLRFSFNEPAFQIFYQPVPAEQRFSFRTMLEGVPKALGVVIAGALILAFNLMGFKSALYLNLLFLAVLIAWLWVTRASYKSYCLMLTSFVHRKFRKEPQAAEVSTDDTVTVEANGVLRLNGAYNCISETEWNEYRRLQEAAAHAKAGEGINERRCIEFMLAGGLPATYFQSWFAADPMIGPLLKARFATTTDMTEGLRIVELMADAGKDMAFLKEQLFSKHPLIGLLAAKKITTGNGKLEGREKSDCKAWIHQLVGSVVWYEACIADLSVEDATIPVHLLTAIAEEKERLTRLLFYGLSFVYDPAAVAEIEESLVKMPSGEGRMLAHELLENFFDADTKEMIIGLFANTEPAEKLQAMAEAYPQRKMGAEERLTDIILKEYQLVPLYIKLLALTELGKRGAAHENILVEVLQNVHPLMAATAARLLEQNHTTLYDASLSRLSPEQQKIATGGNAIALEEVQSLKAILNRQTIAAALLPGLAESWKKEEGDTPRSGILLSLNGGLSIPKDNILYYDHASRVVVIQENTAMPDDSLLFRHKSTVLVDL